MSFATPADLPTSEYVSAPRVRASGLEGGFFVACDLGVFDGSRVVPFGGARPLAAPRAARDAGVTLPTKPPTARAARAPWLDEMLRAVAGLPWVIENWKGWAEPPNHAARRNAGAVLRAISDVAPALRPTEAVPMADEGVLMWLSTPAIEGLPASVECYNSGSIVFAFTEGNQDHAWEVERGALADEVRGLAARLNVAAAER